jgi:hypothetical protein
MRFLCAALLALTLAESARAQPFVLARPAEQFVDSIGFCTHWGYDDTPYGRDYDRVSALLGALGVRHVRDGFHPHLADLYTRFGIRATVIAEPGDAAQAAARAQQSRPWLAMLEGPNEVALFPRSALYNGQGFPEGPRAWMRDLHAALKADPRTARLPLIAPSTGRSGENRRLAPLHTFAYCVMHSYAGGQMPSQSLFSDINNNLTDAWSILGRGADLKRIVATESGYHTALGSDVVLGGAQPGVSERAQSRYLPRQFAEYFRSGIVRTFAYELCDEFPDYGSDEREATNAEACFGILKRDLTPKPAYAALQALIAACSESRWDPVRRRWLRPARTAPPRAVRLAIASDTKDVQSLLLQKPSGKLLLLLWRETPSFDTATRTDIENRPARVTIRQGFSTPPQTVWVPDAVTVVPLPAPPLPAKAPPARPTGVSIRATDTVLHLTWKAPDPKVAPVAGWLVSRLGAQARFVTHPDLGDRRLLPGAGYSYTLQAVDSDGRISAPTTVIGRTRNVFPDLVIRTIETGTLAAGQPVTLSATLINIGQAATPGRRVHGVAFFVDNQLVAWSANYLGPLSPGASQTVTASAGPQGTALWRATPGTHTIRAVADDVDRIAEAHEDNNVLEKEIEVP